MLLLELQEVLGGRWLQRAADAPGDLQRFPGDPLREAAVGAGLCEQHLLSHTHKHTSEKVNGQRVKAS